MKTFFDPCITHSGTIIVNQYLVLNSMNFNNTKELDKFQRKTTKLVKKMMGSAITFRLKSASNVNQI